MVRNKHLFKHFKTTSFEVQVRENVEKNSKNNKDISPSSEVIIGQEEKLLTSNLNHLEIKNKNYEEQIPLVAKPIKTELLVENTLSEQEKSDIILFQNNIKKKVKKTKTKRRNKKNDY